MTTGEAPSTPKAVDRRLRRNIDRVPRRFRLRNGKQVGSRLLRPQDAPLLADFFYQLSPETLQRRFHQPMRDVPPSEVRAGAERLANVDNLTTGGAVLALENGIWGERIVAVARLMRPESEPQSPEAEAAIVVRDDYHGQGVGSELLRRLVLLARKMGVRTMIANIEADNYGALRLFRGLKLPTQSSTSRGETVLRISMPE